MKKKEGKMIRRPRIIAVGGMIASGKSTLCQKLGEEVPNSTSITEFREDDKFFNTMLTGFYEGCSGIELAMQSYFIQHHHERVNEAYNKACEDEIDYIFIDRWMCEHWLFAQTNLKHDNILLQTYNCMYHGYMASNKIKPDLYIMLNITDEEFEKRIYNRGRTMEVENFKKNKNYFKELNSTYLDKLHAQCSIFEIPALTSEINVAFQVEHFWQIVEHLGLDKLNIDELMSTTYVGGMTDD